MAVLDALRYTTALQSGLWFAQVTGGRNGYGAKLANIFSTEFIIETCDGKNLYKQARASGPTWGNSVLCLGASSVTPSMAAWDNNKSPCICHVHCVT